VGIILYKILIVGLGNILMADDGLGIVALKELRKRYGQQKDICLLEVGTSILDYITDIANTETLIVIDAITAGGTAGTIYRIDEESSQLAEGCCLSLDSHGWGLLEAVVLSRKLTGLPDRLLIYGIEPYICKYGIFLSSPVQKSLKKLVDIVQQSVDSILADACRRR